MTVGIFVCEPYRGSGPAVKWRLLPVTVRHTCVYLHAGLLYFFILPAWSCNSESSDAHALWRFNEGIHGVYFQYGWLFYEAISLPQAIELPDEDGDRRRPSSRHAHTIVRQATVFEPCSFT